MALILHIETATLNANICIAKGGKMILYKECENQKTISFLHLAIQEMMQQVGINFTALEAVMVHSGPGSYTGLRIGFSAAKGICYATNKPLIAASSFNILSPIYFEENLQQNNLLIIDNARVNEWYFQYFENKKPQEEACIKTTDEVHKFIENHSSKILSINPIEYSIFEKNIPTQSISTQQMIVLGEKLFKEKLFTDIYQSEPFYCKAAYVK